MQDIQRIIRWECKRIAIKVGKMCQFGDNGNVASEETHSSLSSWRTAYLIAWGSSNVWKVLLVAGLYPVSSFQHANTTCIYFSGICHPPELRESSPVSVKLFFFSGINKSRTSNHFSFVRVLSWSPCSKTNFILLFFAGY